MAAYADGYDPDQWKLRYGKKHPNALRFFFVPAAVRTVGKRGFESLYPGGFLEDVFRRDFPPPEARR